MKEPNFFQRLKLKKFQPIIDYVEGRMSIDEFHKMFNEDRSLRKTLTKPVSRQYAYMSEYDYRLINLFTQDYNYVNKDWNTIHVRYSLQCNLKCLLECYGIKYNQYMKYHDDYDMMLDIQPSWVDVADDTIDKIVYEIPKDISKTKQIAWGKQRVKELFRYDKTYPRWIQGAEWPIVNGKPLVYSHQERVKGEDWRVLYYFYDPDTKEQTVVEQFT